MPDKRIGELPPAPGVYDDSLLAVEQQGIAMHLTGRQFIDLIRTIFDRIADSGGGTAGGGGGVTSFNGRTGAVKPGNNDYTAAMVGAVPTFRTINGKTLTNNIILTAEDLNITGLLPAGGAAGQMLTKTATGYGWIDPPEGGGFIEMESSIPVSSRADNTLYGLILETY